MHIVDMEGDIVIKTAGDIGRKEYIFYSKQIRMKFDHDSWQIH